VISQAGQPAGQPNLKKPTALRGAVGADGSIPATNSIGVADSGTRFLIKVNNLEQGVTLTFGAATGGSGANGSSLLLYVVKGANADGTGGTPGASNTVALVGSVQPGVAVGASAAAQTTQFVVYEVVSEDPNAVESVTITPAVTYVAKPGSNEPALTGTSAPSEALASVSFAPLAADSPGLPLPTDNGNPNTTSIGSLPRFVSSQPPAQIVLVVPCSCNLLFPWVVNDGQFDTGIAVVNTSADPYSSAHAQSGTVSFNFYGSQNGVTPVPAVYTTPPAGSAIVVPSGCAYVLVLSQGGIGLDTCANGSTGTSGNYAVKQSETQMFVGYVIVQTTFQYCHGVAYINQPATAAIGSFYEAIQLDEPFNLLGTGAVAGDSRTGNWGENDGH